MSENQVSSNKKSYTTQNVAKTDKSKLEVKSEVVENNPIKAEIKDKTTSKNVKKSEVSESIFDFPTPEKLSMSLQDWDASSDKKDDEVDNTIKIPYQIDDQGDTNACGTTSLASVLNYYNKDSGKKVDHWAIDKSIRSTGFTSEGMFTSPKSVVEYAQKKGFNAGMKKNTTIDDLVSNVDKGMPTMVLTDVSPEDPHDMSFHWIVVTGYKKDKEGKVTDLTIADPSGGYVSNVDVNDFKKNWANIKGGFNIKDKVKVSLPTGYNNLSIVIVPKNKELTTPEGKKFNTNKVVVPNDWDSFPGFVADKVGKVVLFADKTVQKAKEVKTAVVVGITKAKTAIVGAVSTAKAYATKAISTVKEKVSSAVETTKKYISATVNTVEKKAVAVASVVKDYAKSAINTTTQYVGGTISTAKSYAIGAVSAAKNYASSTLSSAKSYLSSARSYLSF